MIEVIEGETSPEVWLKACTYLINKNSGNKYRDYNVVLGISSPLGNFSPKDRLIYNTLNKFLMDHDSRNHETVAGTIFPASYYVSKQDRSGVFEDYPKMMEKIIKGWGTYAFRMIRRIDENGQCFNPLEKIIDKINAEPSRGKCLELGLLPFDADMQLYDPRTDKNLYMGGPCLSHISIKIIDSKKVNLTALYRNHFYIERLLGNLVGLSQLLSFVAKETKFEVGELIIHSTAAEIDTGKWKLSQVKKLIADLSGDRACK